MMVGIVVFFEGNNIQLLVKCQVVETEFEFVEESVIGVVVFFDLLSFFVVLFGKHVRVFLVVVGDREVFDDVLLCYLREYKDLAV